MKKNLVLLVFTGFLLIPGQLSLAQETVANKLFYAELGGTGVIMSANWDARFSSNSRLGLGYRLGIGFNTGRFPDKQVSDSYGTYYENVIRTIYAFPVGLNYVLGKENRASTFEIGAGATILARKTSLFNYELEKQGHVIGFCNFIYRLMPVNGGFSLRVGFTPLIGTAGDLYPMAAIALGYAF